MQIQDKRLRKHFHYHINKFHTKKFHKHAKRIDETALLPLRISNISPKNIAHQMARFRSSKIIDIICSNVNELSDESFYMYAGVLDPTHTYGEYMILNVCGFIKR